MNKYKKGQDKITLKDFEVVACHGVNPEEKVLPQRFLISVDAFVDMSEASMTDDILQTTSYSDIKKLVRSISCDNCFNLIETLAAKIANAVLQNFAQVESVTVLVKKPDAPMSGVFDYVSAEVKRKWHEVCVSLGSNLGDREKHLDCAIFELNKDKNVKMVVESKRINTEPYGGVADCEFANSAATFKTLYNPYELLEKLHQIESKSMRIRDKRWGNRTLDIDILFFDDVIVDSSALAIPHIDLQNRIFVLEPLAEIAPNFVNPLTNLRVSEMLAKLKNRSCSVGEYEV